jgi:hypothetical protein
MRSVLPPFAGITPSLRCLTPRPCGRQAKAQDRMKWPIGHNQSVLSQNLTFLKTGLQIYYTTSVN